ncbi:MAG: hydantoinase B/oxoprolinase family protein, partial [Gammaproteobacteria bacterium]
CARLEHEARAALEAQGAAPSAIRATARAGVKVARSDTPLTVPWPPNATAAELRAAFADAHLKHFGFAAEGPLVVEWIEVECAAANDAPRGGGNGDMVSRDYADPGSDDHVDPDSRDYGDPGMSVLYRPLPERARQGSRARSRHGWLHGGPARGHIAQACPPPTSPPEPITVRPIWIEGAWQDTPIYRRETLPPGISIDGPALLVEEHGTTYVAPEWRASVRPEGELVLERTTPRADREEIETRADPIMLEVFNNLFMHIAEQMGLVLEHTAHSVNIKERLDFSCALFDRSGELIANAPHVPVHLGSMGESVRTILARFGPRFAPGDAFMLNAPYDGGTHLPDITVVTPVVNGAGELEFVVASRAHHADIGGRTPGSMPPDSRTIDDEGVLIEGMRIVSGGRFLEDDVRSVLASGPYPARNPEQNIADLKAQLAANARGVELLGELVARYGRGVVHAYMGHVKQNAEACVRDAIARLSDGERTVELDGGERISVAVRIDRERREAVIDFAGTSPTSASNLNAPPAIARAVVLYVFRALVRENIPLNAGCLKPLTISLPEDSLVDPRYPAAVVAGNVETSQCIADALLAALGAAAASQGTMNNFTFGNAALQYYETLCGGAGAGPAFDGASAVHTHMTNSRLTDPEVLESRYPVRVRRFEIRRGSGGSGRHRGGDGVVREIEFLAPMHAAILSNRRRTVPFGLAGGGDGAPGRNYVVRHNGEIVELGPVASIAVEAGDRFVIETPGGGGYGAP